MSPRPSHLQTLLRILRHLLLVLGGALRVRAAELRARRDALPPGHRRRAVMEKELRRIAWVREMLADPALLEDAAFRGLAAERARVRADAGRRALVRRYIYPTPLTRLRGAVPAAMACPEEDRCTGGPAVALALPGGPRVAVRAHVPGGPRRQGNRVKARRRHLALTRPSARVTRSPRPRWGMRPNPAERDSSARRGIGYARRVGGRRRAKRRLDTMGRDQRAMV